MAELKIDLNSDLAVADLCALGVPLSVATDICDELQQQGFLSWAHFLQRLFYSGTQHTGKQCKDAARAYPVVPQDHRLLQELGVYIGTNVNQTSRPGHWWTDPLQKLAPPGSPPDDAFPAEFRGGLLSQATASMLSVASGQNSQQLSLARDRELHFSYLFAQVQYFDSNTYQYLGYSLTRSQKDKLLARWATDYPELGENTLAVWDAPLEAQPASSQQTPYHEAQCRAFRKECWDALLRGGMREGQLSRGEAEQLTPPLPDWVGSPGPGGVAGAGIPDELRDQYYRVDPYCNVVAWDAEPYSICAWEVDHVFPRKRGGKSVLQNFAATHWYADRHVKTEKLLCSILLSKDGRNPLTCGLTEAKLSALWEARALLPPALQPTNAFKQLLRTMLCSNWRRGDYRELFNTRAGLLHVTPANQLFRVLLQEFQASVTSLVAGWHVGLLASVGAGEGGEDASQGCDCEVPDGFGGMDASPAGSRRESRASIPDGPPSRRGSSTVLLDEPSACRPSAVATPPRARRHSRVRMDASAVSSRAALRLYNAMALLGQEGSIPELSMLPALADDHSADTFHVHATGRDSDPSTITACDTGTPKCDAASMSATPTRHDVPVSNSHQDQTHKATARRRLPASPEAAEDSSFSQHGGNPDKSTTTQLSLPEVVLADQATFDACSAPSKSTRHMRPRMKSTTTQTHDAHQEATNSTDDRVAGAARPTHQPKVTAGKPPVHPYQHQGTLTWNAIPLPPAMPPSQLTMQEALASTQPPTQPALPVHYQPPYDPVVGTWRLRPRNPLADPYIAEAYDFQGPAGEGSSLTSWGIIGAAVHAVHQPVAPVTAWDTEPSSSHPAEGEGNCTVNSQHRAQCAPGHHIWAPAVPGEARAARADLTATVASSLQFQRAPPTLEMLPPTHTTQELNDLRLQRWGRTPPARPTAAILYESKAEQQAAKRKQQQHPQPAPPTSPAGTIAKAVDLSYKAVDFVTGAAQQHRYQQQMQQGWGLAQQGVFTNLPLWAGGPEPLSNPHLGPGQPHAALLQLLAVHRSQPPQPPVVLGLPGQGKEALPAQSVPAPSQQQPVAPQPTESSSVQQSLHGVQPPQLPVPPLVWPPGPPPPWAVSQQAGVPQGPQPPTTLYPYYHPPSQEQTPVSAETMRQQAPQPPDWQTPPGGVQVWATPDAAAALAASQPDAVPDVSSGPTSSTAVDSVSQECPQDPAPPVVGVDSAADSTGAPVVPKLTLSALSTASDAAPRPGPGQGPGDKSSLSYEQWKSMQSGELRRGGSDASVLYEQQWQGNTEASPAQTPRDMISEEESTTTAPADVPSSQPQTTAKESPQAPVELASTTGSTDLGATHTSVPTPRSPMPTLLDSDLPPPAFDRPRPPRLGHSRLGTMSPGSSGSSPTGPAPLPEDASQAQRLAHKAKKALGKLSKLVKKVGKKGSGMRKVPSNGQEIMPIGILPTSLEVVREEQEDEIDTPTPRSPMSPALLSQLQQEVSSSEAAKDGSPAKRALLAAFEGVKGLLRKNSSATAPSAHVSSYYPPIPTGSPIAAHKAKVSDSTDLMQHADLVTGAQASQDNSPEHSLNQTLRRRGRSQGSLRASIASEEMLLASGRLKSRFSLPDTALGSSSVAQSNQAVPDSPGGSSTASSKRASRGRM